MKRLKKKRYTLYLGIDQMAVTNELARRAGKSLSSFVDEAIRYRLSELGLDVSETAVPSDPEALRRVAREVFSELTT